MNQPIAILLAAGQGQRMGMPKALLEYESGRSFLQTLTSTFARAGCQVLAVVGAGAEQIREQRLRTALIENPDWQSGQFSSVKVGIAAALEEGASAILLHPVDMPLIRASTIKAVLAALDGQEGAVPEFEGAPGHPLALTRAAAEKVLSMTDVPHLEAAAEKVLAMTDVPHLEAAQARLQVTRIKTRDPAVVVNLNTPEVYERVLGFPPRMAPARKRRGAQA